MVVALLAREPSTLVSSVEWREILVACGRHKGILDQPRNHSQGRQCCPPSGPRLPRPRRPAVTDHNLGFPCNESSRVRNVPVGHILLDPLSFLMFYECRVLSSVRPWHLALAATLPYTHRRHSTPCKFPQPVTLDYQTHDAAGSIAIGWVLHDVRPSTQAIDRGKFRLSSQEGLATSMA
jgi:hypothetical protein